jgi:serine protease Do
MGISKKGKDINTDNTPEITEDEKKEDIIQEQIKPWHKRKFKKTLSVIGLSLLAGIIFGIAARFVFKYSDGFISRLFGLNQPYDTSDNQPVITISPGQDAGKSVSDTGVTIGTKTEDEPKTETQEKYTDGDGTAISGYRRAMDEMRRRAEKVKKGMVKIDAVSNYVNWMGDSVEQSEWALGIMVAENPSDLLILTYYDKVKNADNIDVTLASGNTYSASVLASDDSYNIAVLSMPKQIFNSDDLANISLVEIGNSDDIYAGMPIMAIGTVDGNGDVLEYGTITGADYAEYITDSVISIFTTNVEHSETGEGVVVDLDGKIIGIISRKLGTTIRSSVNKCVRVNNLIKIAEMLCNGNSRLYFGLKFGDLPARVLRENNIENGIYVNGVEPSSPSSDAGIRKGDFILSVDGVKVESAVDFAQILQQAGENNECNIEIYRISKTSEPRFTVTVKPVKKNS